MMTGYRLGWSSPEPGPAPGLHDDAALERGQGGVVEVGF